MDPNAKAFDLFKYFVTCKFNSYEKEVEPWDTQLKCLFLKKNYTSNYSVVAKIMSCVVGGWGICVEYMA